MAGAPSPMQILGGGSKTLGGARPRCWVRARPAGAEPGLGWQHCVRGAGGRRWPPAARPGKRTERTARAEAAETEGA